MVQRRVPLDRHGHLALTLHRNSSRLEPRQRPVGRCRGLAPLTAQSGCARLSRPEARREVKAGRALVLVALKGSARGVADGLVRRRSARPAADGEAQMRRTPRRGRVARPARAARPCRRVAQTRFPLREVDRPLRSPQDACHRHPRTHKRGQRRVPDLRAQGVCGCYRRPQARARRTLVSLHARHARQT